MFANCLKNNYVNSLYDVYVLVLILHVPYGNHRKMLGLTCLNKFLCMYVCMYVCIDVYVCKSRIMTFYMRPCRQGFVSGPLYPP
jgi:hypothetical protein